MPLIAPSVGSGLTVATGTPSVIDPRSTSVAIIPGGTFGVAAGTPGVIAANAPGLPPVPPVAPPILVATATVAQAIRARWLDRDDVTHHFVDGKLWSGEAPATVKAMPYAVLTQVSDVETARSTRLRFHTGTYQLSVMADDLFDAETLCRAVADVFDGATLDLDGFMSCFAGDVRWMLGVGLGLGGEDCWTSYVELEILYTR